MKPTKRMRNRFLAWKRKFAEHGVPVVWAEALVALPVGWVLSFAGSYIEDILPHAVGVQWVPPSVPERMFGAFSYVITWIALVMLVFYREQLWRTPVKLSIAFLVFLSIVVVFACSVRKPAFDYLLLLVYLVFVALPWLVITCSHPHQPVDPTN